VGDAADFYDPFTGEGVYAALRGADMLTAIVANLLESDRLGAADLAAYDRSRRREFSGKWMLERIIAWAVGHPFALDHVARRLKTKPHLADLLVGVTGDFVPARQVLQPGFTLQMVW
jgi:flavin-dependent dehydrogenase